MALEQTITIVNNSGKIISTGKQLFSIFKEAQASYKDKKAQIKSERSLQRAQTFDPRTIPAANPYYEDDEQYYYERAPRRSFDGGSDHGSRRSHRTRSVYSQRRLEGDTRSRPALTEYNLKTLSEVSSTAPSRAPRQYTSPYAETLPMDMAISRRDLLLDETRSMALTNRDPGTMARRRSESELMVAERKPHKEIDMDLAYGNIPPDLEFRTDLDPVNKEKTAKSLVRRVEGLLDEAHCVQHSATATMAHLQKNPQAAAAVALSLAELSKLVTSMSPAFLGLLKGSSPAVFSLLASPQFLIGTSIAVGVTVVMFGGWKIVKKVKEAQVAREALAWEGVPMDRPAPLRTQSEFTTGMDEALILDDDLSSIETWRRGIPAFGEDESADLELITPVADKAAREAYEEEFDLKSRKSTRTSRTHRSHRTERTERTERSHRSSHSHRHRSHSAGDDRGSSSRRRSPDSIADSDRSSHRSGRSKRKERVEMKAIEDGKGRRKSETELVIRPKSQNMLKALFKSKEKKERREMVLA